MTLPFPTLSRMSAKCERASDGCDGVLMWVSLPVSHQSSRGSGNHVMEHLHMELEEDDSDQNREALREVLFSTSFTVSMWHPICMRVSPSMVTHKTLW